MPQSEPGGKVEAMKRMAIGAEASRNSQSPRWALQVRKRGSPARARRRKLSVGLRPNKAAMTGRMGNNQHAMRRQRDGNPGASVGGICPTEESMVDRSDFVAAITAP